MEKYIVTLFDKHHSEFPPGDVTRNSRKSAATNNKSSFREEELFKLSDQ